MRVVSLKAVATATGAGIASLVGLATLHTSLVVPAILERAREQTETIIERVMRAHQDSPHRDAVGRREWDLVLHHIQRVATKEGQAALEIKLESIEKRLGVLETRSTK